MKRSEIWLLNLDPTIGAEIGKTRPAVIVSDDAIGVLPLKIVAPITDWKDRYVRYKWMVRIEVDIQNNLSKPAAVDAFQLRSVAHERFIRRIGELNEAQVQELTDALALTLSIP
jgi:mRNA interferase MazF